MRNTFYAFIIIFTIIYYCAINAVCFSVFFEDIESEILRENTEAAWEKWNKHEKYTAIFVKDNEIDAMQAAFRSGEIELINYRLNEIKNGILPKGYDIF